VNIARSSRQAAAAPRSAAEARAQGPYLEAPTPEQLNEGLAKLSDELASCQLELGAPPQGADTNRVNLCIDGEVIPFDAQGAKQNGWGWANDARQTMSMYGDACSRFKKSPSTNLVVEFGRTPIVVVLH
jgi:hypothetical protein